jgi:hypothetical protein
MVIAMPQETQATIPEISLFLTQQVFEFAKDSTTIILEGKQSKLEKIVSKFSNNPEKERQRFKLNYHVAIAYVVVALVDLEASSNFRSYARQILDGMVELFYEAVTESSKNIDAGLVVGDEFIKDHGERSIVLSELRQADPKFSNLSGLPRLGLTAITDFLLEKRLNEYRQMWIADMQRINQPGFVALMPSRVYQHWSGADPESFESLSFNLLLFNGLMGFSTGIQQALGMMKVKR